MRIITGLVIVLLISSCANSPKLGLLSDGACLASQKQLVTDHIGNQIKALSNGDFSSAYKYAAKSFQENITLEQFKLIISGQYQMLIENPSIKFTRCKIEDEVILQEVVVTGITGKSTLAYQLTAIDEKLGIIGATIRAVTTDLTT